MAFPFPDVDIPDYESNINQSVINWKANSDFRYGGFQGLHEVANRTLWGIFPNFRENVSGLHLNPNNIFSFEKDNYDVDELVVEFTSVLVLGSIILLVGAILAIMGVVWCISKCCCSSGDSKRKLVAVPAEYVENRFGGQSQQQLILPKRKRTKNTSCKIGLGIFILCSNVVYLTFLIGLFIANSQLRDSIGTILEDVDDYVVDAETFIDITKEQINGVMVTSYGNFSEVIEKFACGVPRSFLNAKNALLKLENNLDRIKNERQDLKLNDEVSLMLSTLSTRTSAIRQKVFIGPADVCQDVKNVLSQSKDSLAEAAKEMTDSLDDIPISSAHRDIKDFQKYFDDAKDGSFAGVTVLNIFMLIIMALNTIGVIFLFLPPSTRTGSILINIGIFLMFLTGFLLCILTLVLFVVSGTLVSLIPGVYENIKGNGSLFQQPSPSNPNILQSRNIDEPQSSYKLPTIQHILKNCSMNESAYKVFNLSQLFNLSAFDELRDDIIENIFPPGSVRKSPVMEVLLYDIKMETVKGSDKDLDELIISTKNLDSELQSLLFENKESSDRLDVHLNVFIDFAKKQVQNETGRCTPLNNVIQSTIHIFSYKLGSPGGVFWLSLNINVFLFIPIAIASIAILKQG